MRLPERRDIDSPLVVGSLVFGVGWGLVGFCPGPAIVSMGSGQLKAALFVAAMLVGMLIYIVIEKLRQPREEQPENREAFY